MLNFCFYREKQRSITKLWDGYKNFIEKISNKLREYEKDFMKIKLKSDDNLLLNKMLNLHMLTVIGDLFLKRWQILSTNFLR